MGGPGKGDTSIQAYFPPAPTSSPEKSYIPSSDPPSGDGFTAEEVQDAVKAKPAEPWHPPGEYAELEIQDLEPGPKAVTFMGRVANIFDVANTPKTPRSAKGCMKLCVKDDKGAITVISLTMLFHDTTTNWIEKVRLWYARRMPNIRLGSLVSVWTTHSTLCFKVSFPS